MYKEWLKYKGQETDFHRYAHHRKIVLIIKKKNKFQLFHMKNGSEDSN